MVFFLSAWLFAANVVVQPLVDCDVLEPSVQNEVDHALAKVESITPRVERQGRSSAPELLPFPTNGMSRTDIAIRLVSTQRADGRWLVGTNDVTAAAVEILRVL